MKDISFGRTSKEQVIAMCVQKYRAIFNLMQLKSDLIQNV